MARKQERTITLKIKLTKGAFKKIEEAAFKNCRTPEQEGSYIVEKCLAGSVKDVGNPWPMVRYDDPAPVAETTDPPAVVDHAPSQPAVMTTWTAEQEAAVDSACKSAGMSEGEITAAKLIHKTPEAVLESIKEPAAA